MQEKFRGLEKINDDLEENFRLSQTEFCIDEEKTEIIPRKKRKKL